jgi:hypothetical protein
MPGWHVADGRPGGEPARLSRFVLYQRPFPEWRGTSYAGRLGPAGLGCRSPGALVTDDVPAQLIDPSVSHSARVWNYAVYGAVSDEAVAQWNRFGTPAVTLRSPEQIAGLLDGLELIEPGVVPTPRWRPGSTQDGRPARDVDQFCAVARKP